MAERQIKSVVHGLLVPDGRSRAWLERGVAVLKVADGKVRDEANASRVGRAGCAAGCVLMARKAHNLDVDADEVTLRDSAESIASWCGRRRWSSRTGRVRRCRERRWRGDRAG